MKDLDQKIPSFPNCDNYGIRRASNPNPLNDDTKTNDNELHQQLCVAFKIDYLQEMDIITKVKARLERKINVTLPALLPNKVVQDSRGLATSSDKTGHEEHNTRSRRAIPLLVSCTEEFQGIRFFFIYVEYRSYHKCSRNQYRLMLHLIFHLLERSVKLFKDVR